MRQHMVRRARVPMVVMASLLGALASFACGGDEEPGGKTGSGLGKGGSGTGGSGAKGGGGGTISVGSGGTTGKGGSVNVGGSSSGGSSSGGSTLTDGEACASIARDSKKAEVALLFMVDISGSMNCPVPEQSPPCEVDPNQPFDDTRWTEMEPALTDFFDAPASAGLWAGISFFSRNGSCNERDYERPDSEIALLPGASMALDRVVSAQRPSGQTPTLPSLQGALNHAADWAAAHADQNVVVVYATDGYPKGCDSSNTIDNAAKAAADAFAGPHQIRTYVLGVGPNLSDLNKIAASGGTEQAALIDTGQDVTAQLTAKFDAIRSAVAVDCTYTVPAPPAGQTLNPSQVNVNYTSGTKDPVAIPFDDTGKCAEGWEYNADMTQIVLCGSTCDQIKKDANASIQVLFGCDTVTVSDPR